MVRRGIEDYDFTNAFSNFTGIFKMEFDYCDKGEQNQEKGERIIRKLTKDNRIASMTSFL